MTQMTKNNANPNKTSHQPLLNPADDAAAACAWDPLKLLRRGALRPPAPVYATPSAPSWPWPWPWKDPPPLGLGRSALLAKEDEEEKKLCTGCCGTPWPKCSERGAAVPPPTPTLMLPNA